MTFIRWYSVIFTQQSLVNYKISFVNITPYYPLKVTKTVVVHKERQTGTEYVHWYNVLQVFMNKEITVIDRNRPTNARIANFVSSWKTRSQYLKISFKQLKSCKHCLNEVYLTLTGVPDDNFVREDRSCRNVGCEACKLTCCVHPHAGKLHHNCLNREKLLKY